MIQVNINDAYSFSIPGSWNELNAEQLKAICVPLLSLSAATDEDTKSYWLSKICLLLADNELKYPITGTLAETSIIYNLLPRLNYLKTVNLTRQLLPIIRIRKRIKLYRLHGPADNFNNLTMGEFEDCEYWMGRIQANEADREQAVNMLCGILYRAYGDRKGDDRVAYCVHDNEKNADVFALCDEVTKVCILLFYMGCRNSLVNDFSLLFSGKGDSSNLTWADFAHSLAGPVLGSIDDVYNRPVRQVFFEMRRIKMQADELEEQRKQQT